MMGFRAWAAAAVLVVAAGACGSSSSSSEGESRTRPNRRQPPDVTTPTPAPSQNSDVSRFLAAIEALPTSTFAVSYAITGDPYLTDATVYWSDPNVRLDSAYNGRSFRVYTNASTGTVTICLEILGQTACDSDTATEIAAGYEAVKQLSPVNLAESAKALALAPGTLVSTRSIAAQEAICAVNLEAQEICLAPSGAVLYLKGAVTLSVNAGAAEPLTLEATEYTESVSPSDFEV